MSRVLMVSSEAVGENISGPAIRAIELSRVLGTTHDVTLAAPNETSVDVGVPLAAYRHEKLRELAAEFDVVFVAGLTLAFSPGLARLDVPIILDIYPFTLENLELHVSDPVDERIRDSESLLHAVWTQFARADFLVTVSEKQRDLWLGLLHAMGRLNPYNYDDDPTLRRLIDVVPFGLPADPPLQRAHGIKGAWPGIGPGDFVAYFGSGLYDWLDPVTAVRAAGLAASRNPRIRLFFPATKHPNPDVAPMAALAETRRVSEELGLTDRVVFFNDWVPYASRADFLLDSDVGLSLHNNHLETVFAFRTRVLDYFWAGLPVIGTAGDVLAGVIESRDLGTVVPVGDAVALAQALLRLAGHEHPRERYAARVAAVAEGLKWPRISGPIDTFCRSPRRAPDRAAGYRFVPSGATRQHTPGKLGKALASLQQGGPAQLWTDIRSHVARRQRGA
jgi:glycosyltransferase involved in cell wall biosynthesis